MVGADHHAETVAESGDPLVRVRLFGSLEFRYRGAVIGPLASARARSVLGLLLCRVDEWHPRQALAFTLWPDSAESQARTNLRNVLHAIRRGLPLADQYLETSGGSLRWRSDATCWVDLTAFRERCERASAAARGSDAELDALREAAALVRGDLLADCYDDWAIMERERVRDGHLAVLRRLATSLSDRGLGVEAIRAARELTRRSPFDEDGYRLLMRVHAAAGDRTGVMRAYHECAAVLRQELGVDPAPTTRRMFSDLTDAAAAVTSARTEGRHGDLVGRSAELDHLRSQWDVARHQRARLVVLSGEAGIGKTRLAEEFAGWVAHQGATVCHARAYPAGDDLGFGVVVSWLRHQRVMDRIGHLDRAVTSELARLLPELGEARPTAIETSVDVDRVRLFEACAIALTEAGGPVLLVLDDAQWSDVPSLQFVHHLLRAPRWALLVVATVRGDELQSDHLLSSIAGGLAGDDAASHLVLRGLTREQTGELAGAVAGTSLDDEAVDILHGDTAGNPLFVVETLRARLEGGGEFAVTPRLRAAIGARLARLAPTARDLIGHAAAVGRAFTPDLLGRVSGLDERSLVRGIDELWRRGLIREHGSDAYDFSHGAIRDAAYEALSPVFRRRSHVQIAHALIATCPDAAPVSGQVAVNLDRAGHGREAIEWYRSAARHAHLRSAYDEAVRFLERARQLCRELSDPADREMELAVLSMLSTAIAAADSYGSPRQDEVLLRATTVSASLGIDLDPTLLRARVMSDLCCDRFDEARDAATRLAESAVALGDTALAVESQYLLGISAFWGCELVAAREHFERVMERFDPATGVEHALRFGHDPRIVCASRLANTLWFLGEDGEAVRTRDLALALANETPHRFSANVARVFSAVLAVDRGDPSDIRLRAAELAGPGDRSWVFDVNAEAFGGFVEVIEGGQGGLARIAAAVAAYGGASPAPGALSTLTRVLVGAYEFGGAPAAGLAAAGEALRLDGTRLWDAEILRLRSVLLGRTGASHATVLAELQKAAHAAHATRQAGSLHRIMATRATLIASTS